MHLTTRFQDAPNTVTKYRSDGQPRGFYFQAVLKWLKEHSIPRSNKDCQTRVLLRI